MRHALVLLALLPCTAFAQSFDYHAHCKHIGEVGGGSYAIEEGCLTMERDAIAKLNVMTIEPRIRSHCAHIGEVGGGSYTIMLGCVQMEVDAKSRIDR